jgi:ribosomal protein S18 acetylase RimI-like enzyme
LPPLFLDHSLNVNKRIPSYFLLYEENQLISFVNLFVPTTREAEVTGCTLPEYRRQGYFQSLLRVAKEQLELHGINGMLLVCDSRSDTARQMADKLNAVYEFTEYTLKYDPSGKVRESSVPASDRVYLRVADSSDLETLVRLSCPIFDETPESAEPFISNTLASDSRVQYLILRDGLDIGIATVSYKEDCVYIHGFGIEPAYQGKGIGRQALNLILQELESQNVDNLAIDVNSANDRAYRLYATSGFKVEVATEYYRLP